MDRATTIVDSGAGTLSRTYDLLDRMTEEVTPEGTVTCAYDAAGRRSTMQVAGQTSVSYSYDNADRLTSVTQGTARCRSSTTMPTAAAPTRCRRASSWSMSFSYDSNGNLTGDGVKSYTWNARNELTALSGGVSASFAYDGVGRRRAKTVASTTTQFFYDDLNPVQELASGTPTANLLTGLGIDEFFIRTDSAGARHFLSDALASSIALTDGSGAVQSSYSYEPFGSVTTSGVSTGNTFAFTGREADGTGLYFYRARYYDPRLQRFSSEDRISFASGESNLHAYVSNDPANRVDPTGEVWFAAPLIGGAVGGGIDLGVQLWTHGGNFGCVSWGSVGTSALSGVFFGSLGPGGAFFGRAKYGAPKWFGNVNRHNFRVGWSWNGTFKSGRNYFGVHGGRPNTAGHWHKTPIPGTRTAADVGWGVGGGAVAGARGGSGTCGSPAVPPPGGDGGAPASPGGRGK